ncbi:MAG: prepilin-type N-terminal cleavage/methylation domain-containing protein [Pseudomonadota bacterium]|nr:prepilin-type N-terminal cleavage/methylation domain-containing protein [Pseudomonadota bacterium]
MRRIQQGFSLVELMIVVAIIGILAAIAIPNFITMQLKAKRAEVPGNVDGIKTAEIAYDAAFDGFIPATVYPGAIGKAQTPWVVADSGGFGTIGWAPDGAVRGQYLVALQDNSVGVPGFLVTGNCDVDGDTDPATYTATDELNALLTTANTIY